MSSEVGDQFLSVDFALLLICAVDSPECRRRQRGCASSEHCVYVEVKEKASMVRVDDLVKVNCTTVDYRVSSIFGSQKVIDASSFFASRYFRVGSVRFNQDIAELVLRNELSKSFIIVRVT